LELGRNLASSSPILLASAVLLLVDLAVGDPQLFTLINLGMSNPILDIACAYGSILLFASSSLFSLAALYASDRGEMKRDARASGIVALLTGPLSYGLGSLLKVVVGRPRPFEVLPTRTVGIWHTSSFSFPSTTTMLAFGFALPILFDRPRLGIPLVALAAFIGFSVVYTGFHYPGDVIVGTLLSTVIALSTSMAKPRIARLLAKHSLD